MKGTSNIDSFENSRISDEAASWIAQLDSRPLSAEDKLSLAEWMARSPRHALEIKRLARLWGNVDLLVDTAVSTHSEKPERLIRLLPTWFSLQPVRVTAFLMVPILLAALMFFPENPDNTDLSQVKVYSVERGEQKDYLLEDGSSIHLNTNSIVEVSYHSSYRRVHLLQGEALFDVAKDASRPFQVYAGATVVEAVGTAFLVRLYDQDIDVTVTEGRVRLNSATPDSFVPGADSQTEKRLPGTLLEEGYKAHVRNELEDVHPVNEREIENSMAWRQGLLVFDGESLEHVVSEVGRYMPQKIIISDPDLRALQIGGVFKIGEIDTLLTTLEASLGLEVNRVRSDLIYLNAGSNN